MYASPPPYGQPYTAPAPAPRKSNAPKIILAVAALVLAVCGGLGLVAFLGGSAEDAGRGTAEALQDTAPAPASSGKSKSAAAELRAGDHRKVKAGTWVTTAPEDALFGCTWQRVKNFSGDAGAFIAGDVVAPGTSGEVNVKPNDGGLKLDGPCVWRRA
jgi:hypothetical protein